MNSDKYWDRLVEAAINIPASGPLERAAWKTRNFCELGLYLRASGLSFEPLDDLIARSDLSLAPTHLARRLVAIREGENAGSPISYAAVERPAELAATDPKYANAALAMCNFADRLMRDAPPDEGMNAIASPLGGLGRKVILDRNAWRPTYNGFNAEFKERVELPPETIRRGWMFIPSIGPTMLVVDEKLDLPRLDVWWGVHVGCHLDLLAWHGEHSPSRVEFGKGLLVSEALAVVLEILAALEANGPAAAACRNTVANGLIERAGRLRLPDNYQAGPSYLAAQKCAQTEFAALPTIAAAYICGPLELFAAKFSHPSIPTPVAHQLNQRLQALHLENYAFRELTKAADELFRKPYLGLQA